MQKFRCWKAKLRFLAIFDGAVVIFGRNLTEAPSFFLTVRREIEVALLHRRLPRSNANDDLPGTRAHHDGGDSADAGFGISHWPLSEESWRRCFSTVTLRQHRDKDET